MTRFVNMIGAAAVLLAATSAGYAADFNRAVSTVLKKQEAITKLPKDKQGEMIACAQKVLAKVPAGKKRYLEEAKGYDQTESRFGEIVLADQARFKQEITKVCGSIAVSD